jgi:hypothetical protein
MPFMPSLCSREANNLCALKKDTTFFAVFWGGEELFSNLIQKKLFNTSVAESGHVFNSYLKMKFFTKSLEIF